MVTAEKELAVGRIAASALGKMMREIVKVQKEKGPQKWSANQILENIVMEILKQSQKDIRAVMEDRVAEESGQ